MVEISSNWNCSYSLEPEVPPVPSKHRIRRADTNVLSINFRTLKEPSGVFTGEAEMCRSCRSVLSVLSVLRSKEEGEEKVRCEVVEVFN